MNGQPDNISDQYSPLSCVDSMANMLRAVNWSNRNWVMGIGDIRKTARNSRSIWTAHWVKDSILHAPRKSQERSTRPKKIKSTERLRNHSQSYKKKTTTTTWRRWKSKSVSKVRLSSTNHQLNDHHPLRFNDRSDPIKIPIKRTKRFTLFFFFFFLPDSRDQFAVDMQITGGETFV